MKILSIFSLKIFIFMFFKKKYLKELHFATLDYNCPYFACACFSWSYRISYIFCGQYVNQFLYFNISDDYYHRTSHMIIASRVGYPFFLLIFSRNIYENSANMKWSRAILQTDMVHLVPSERTCGLGWAGQVGPTFEQIKELSTHLFYVTIQDVLASFHISICQIMWATPQLASTH